MCPNIVDLFGPPLPDHARCSQIWVVWVDLLIELDVDRAPSILTWEVNLISPVMDNDLINFWRRS